MYNCSLTGPDKCKVMNTHASWNDRSDIQVAGLDIESFSDFCYLGIYISCNGSWKNMLKHALEKQQQCLGKIKRSVGITG